MQKLAIMRDSGFWTDSLISVMQLSEPKNDFFGELSKARICGRDIYLLKPTTFMNRSGQSIVSVANYFRIAVENILIVHDELDLAAGTIRLKQGGGHGGHNGLRDSIAVLGKEFWRLRLGIGHPGHKDDVVSYVLKRASNDEQQLIDDAIDSGIQAAEWLFGGQLNKAMQMLHSRK